MDFNIHKIEMWLTQRGSRALPDNLSRASIVCQRLFARLRANDFIIEESYQVGGGGT